MKVRLSTTSPTHALLPVADVTDGVITLTDGSMRAVLECPTLAFGLKGELEQRAVATGWGGLLNSLAHPIQVGVMTRGSAAPGTAPAPDGVRGRLEGAQGQLLRELAQRRRTVERRFLLVVPGEPDAGRRKGLPQLLSRQRWSSRHSPSPTAETTLLDQRVRWVTESLRRIDIDPRRLSSGEVSDLFYRALCPQVAEVQPLPREEAGTGWAGMIAPAAFTESPVEVRLGDRLARTLAVTGYPQLLRPAWLEVLLGYDGDLDLSLHICPTPTQAVMSFLNRRVAELASTARIAEEGGRSTDPYRRAALADAEDLQDRLARGEERLFDMSLYATVWADGEEALDAASRRVEELLGSMLVLSRRLLFRMEPGLISSLPLGLDRVGLRRCLPTSVLSATFPFTGNDLGAASGVLYGINPEAKSPVVLDRFALPNHNAVVFATSGAGKSFLVKVELIRSWLSGTRIVVVDPEGEYAPIVQALGGTVIQVRPGVPVAIDPFSVTEGVEGALSARIASLLTLTEILSGGLTPNQRAAAEEALSFAYASHGFTDGGQVGSELPRIADVQAALTRRLEQWTASVRAEVDELALRLERYAHGSASWLFEAKSEPAHPATGAKAYVLAGLPEEDRAPAMFLVLDRIWSELEGNAKPTIVAVDEAWWLMQYPDTARFLQRLAKTARKRHAGLTLISQDVGDVLDNPIGEAVVSNAAVQILMKQAAQAMPRLTALFQLTHAEQSWLLNAQQGEGLLMAMGKRVPFKVIASTEELAVMESDRSAGEQAA
ncbi:MAG: TraG/VirB4 family ATPase [Candidatus Dormibacteria bacterium]